jgi:hypothetical protein
VSLSESTEASLLGTNASPQETSARLLQANPHAMLHTKANRIFIRARRAETEDQTKPPPPKVEEDRQIYYNISVFY